MGGDQAGSESVAVPTQGEFPHDRNRSGHPAVDVFLRPEEADVRSCLDDVIPPVPGRDREVNEPIARLAGQAAVLDPEVDGSVVVEPAGLDFGINAERSGIARESHAQLAHQRREPSNAMPGRSGRQTEAPC